MALGSTGVGSLASGYLAQGQTTIRWGTKNAITTINGTAVNGIEVGVVTRFNQRALAENNKLPQGDGLTVTRVQIVDGGQWDLTIRDDTNITNRPKIGTTIVVADGAGYFGAVGTYYSTTVVETGYETAPKQAAEFSLTVEALTLIELP